jgi:hypothetical protein
MRRRELISRWLGPASLLLLGNCDPPARYFPLLDANDPDHPAILAPTAAHTVALLYVDYSGAHGVKPGCYDFTVLACPDPNAAPQVTYESCRDASSQWSAFSPLPDSRYQVIEGATTQSPRLCGPLSPTPLQCGQARCDEAPLLDGGTGTPDGGTGNGLNRVCVFEELLNCDDFRRGANPFKVTDW